MSEPTNDGPERPAAGTRGNSRSVFAAIATDDKFQASNALTPGAMVDAGIPLVVFTAVYFITGRELTTALWAAIGTGVAVAAIRLVRRDSLQNVISGFIGLGIAVLLARMTGRAEDIFLPGLLINVAYASAFFVSVLVRWPLVGVFVGLVTGHGTSWRDDPALVRAYLKATALFAVVFTVRLAVQVPLYLQGEEQLGWLATARLGMGWPLYLLAAFLCWLMIKPAYQAHQQRLAAAERRPTRPDDRPPC